MNKSPEMVAALDSITRKTFGFSRSDALKSKVCVSCGKNAHAFKDALSEKEYGISGLCQPCQDSVFGA